ncbi:unknown [Eggerthella sp. CAG:298]|nr:unknown [Eggerthella sp. CAG:298]
MIRQFGGGQIESMLFVEPVQLHHHVSSIARIALRVLEEVQARMLADIEGRHISGLERGKVRPFDPCDELIQALLRASFQLFALLQHRIDLGKAFQKVVIRIEQKTGKSFQFPDHRRVLSNTNRRSVSTKTVFNSL